MESVRYWSAISGAILVHFSVRRFIVRHRTWLFLDSVFVITRKPWV